MAEVIDISKTKVCYDLPNSKDPKIFGPDFWAAFHDLASRIPCDGCREETVAFEVFHHDLKNYDLGKPIQDKTNFNYWLKKLESVQNQKERKRNRVILTFISAIIVTILIVVLIRK